MPSEPNLHKIASFDPFQSRLCRDIRNELSESLMKSIHNRDVEPSCAVAEMYLSADAEQFIKRYINDRIARYNAIIDQIRSANIKTHETYSIAVLLWDQELFFEVHEWLEKKVSTGGNNRDWHPPKKNTGSYLPIRHSPHPQTGQFIFWLVLPSPLFRMRSMYVLNAWPHSRHKASVSWDSFSF